MRKKLTKIIESAIPRVYDEDGEILNKKDIANKIIDKLPSPERLDLEPFEVYIPFECSSCPFNGLHKGCRYIDTIKTELDEKIPNNCPLGHGGMH
jgi:hypothetical protein